MRFRRSLIIIALSLFALLFVVAAAPEWPAFGDQSHKLEVLVGPERRFDFVRWEINAFKTKLQGVFSNDYGQAPESLRSDQVLSFLDDIGRARQYQAEVDRIFVDPLTTDPGKASAVVQGNLDALRGQMTARQPEVESIMQQQVAAVLAEEGLTLAGMTFPPVLMHVSRLPNMLVVSPRDRIEQVDYSTLVPEITTEEMDSLENSVFDEMDMSGLVVGLGGLGTYPSMIQETTSVERLAEVTAHEWAHHWLSLHPAGLRYLDSPEMRTINETTASIVGTEIGAIVTEQFYPAPAPQPDAVARPSPTPSARPAEFDFSAEMAETRITVDELLAEGQIEAAEAYMEQRRQLFVAHGYQIRKLNQAYFAMYGGYAGEPGGAAGSDPVGPMLRDIRDHSLSLKAFLNVVGGITSFEDLITLYRDIVGEEPVYLTN